jgi:KDO2-lipid IV(A) lauroyltransferase
MPSQPFPKKLRDDFFYLLVLLFIKTLRLMPRRPALAMMGRLGRLAFLLAKGPRQRTIDHLAGVYGREKSRPEIIKLARAVFIHFATVAADMLRLPNLIRNDLNRLVTARGTEHLDRAFKEGKGVIILTCHFGNWEVMAAWLARNGYPMKAVGTALFDPRLDKLLIEIRTSAGNTAITRGKATRDIIRALKKGEAVGILIDQDTKSEGVFVNFFGRPAHTPSGPAILARRLDVPIIPVFMYLNSEMHYELECLPPLPQVRTTDEAADITTNTQKISDVYEAMIRRFPEQWVWMHKRWKTRPRPARDHTP